MAAAFRSFLKWNERLSERLARSLPHTRRNIAAYYDGATADLIGDKESCTVLDLGAGAECSYAARLEPGNAVVLVGMDVSEASLRRNKEISLRLVADVASSIPLPDESADVISSRWFLEHVKDMESMLSECARVLKDGGCTIHLATCRYAWFALINRVLSHRLMRSLLYALHPQSKARGGLPAFYDQCYPSALMRSLQKHNLEVMEVAVNYGTNYGFFLLPVFLLTSLYEMVLQAFRLRNLSSSFVVIARKRTTVPAAFAN